MAPSSLDIDPIFLEAIENLPDGISIFDQDGRPLLHNSVSERRFPALYEAFRAGAGTYDEALACSVRHARPDFSEAEVDEQVRLLGGFATSGQTYEVKTPDDRIVQITFRPMANGRRVAISVDVTELRMRQKELKKAQAAAVAASNAKSAFLANMSHEIRTPLNGILGMAQVLDMGDLSPEQRDQVTTILDSGRNLMALLNDVLDLSKIEAGKIAVVRSDADLGHVMRSLHRLWKPRADEAGIEFNLHLDADLPARLSFDAVRVRQCVSNLISNAIKFTPKGRVEVVASARAQADGQYLVKIRITDTGVGMDCDTIDRLFRPFVQADDSTSRRFGGTGLGLSITRKLAELMGGAATVTSELGRGSVFTFTFLAGEASLHRTDSAESTPSSEQLSRDALRAKALRVLLVDDHPINRQVASLFLRPFNMRIVEAANGREALARLASEAFDVVLLDVHMPVMDGTETIAEIRCCGEPWSSTPVIALTADAMSGDRERYLGLGMDGYLAKPLSERDLIAEINRVQSLTAEQLAASRARGDRAA
jgi:hypothetical protein